MSLCAIMVIQTGASLSHRVAAVFSAGGAVPWGWPIVPTHPVALLMLTGTKDVRVPVNASTGLAKNSAKDQPGLDTGAMAVGEIPTNMNGENPVQGIPPFAYLYQSQQKNFPGLVHTGWM
jgi:hypothetical protein